MSLARDRIVRLLVERFRHRPKFLPVRQTVQIIRRLIRHAVPAAPRSRRRELAKIQRGAS